MVRLAGAANAKLKTPKLPPYPRWRQKNRRRDQSPPIYTNNCREYQTSYFLTATFFAGETAFFATFFAGAFFGVAFFTGAAFLAAGFAVDFFAAGINYPPFHSAVAEDKKLISLQFA